MASRRSNESAPRRRRISRSRVRSITRTSGSGAAGRPPAGTRSGIDRRTYLPACTLATVSRLGVADPSTQTAPARCARITATSRAW